METAEKSYSDYGVETDVVKAEVIRQWLSAGGNRPVKVVAERPTEGRGIKGYITQEKFIIGRTPGEMEHILGLLPNELCYGAHVMGLVRLPDVGEFELKSYTNLPDGKRPHERDPLDKHKPGLGAPQWRLTTELPAFEIRYVPPGQPYRSACPGTPAGKG